MPLSNLLSFNLTIKETNIAKHFPVTHLLEPCIFVTQTNQLGCVIEINGVPFDTATNEQLNQYKRLWHHVLVNLSDDFSLYTYLIRNKFNPDIRRGFPNKFTETVNRKYVQQFKDNHFFQNRLYLVLLYKGINVKKLNDFLSWFDKINQKKIKLSKQVLQVNALERLKKTSQQLLILLSQFQTRLLGQQDSQLGYSELIRFFSCFINTEQTIRFQLPIINSYFTNPLDKQISSLKLYPFGRIASLIADSQLFFGDFIELHSNNSLSKFAVMLSIKNYPSQTFPLLLNKLMQLNCELINTQTFIIESNQSALHLINKQLTKLTNSNDAAHSQQQQLFLCKDQIASEQLKLGYHHNTLMLIANSQEELKQAINQAIKTYAEAGIVAIQETLGQEAAFWAQIPGNQRYIARSSLINSENFVDFFPLHNYPTGYYNLNHLGGAVTLLTTPAQTPVYFNFHSKGSGNHNDLTPGHTTIIGGNGSGKTVFLGFMDSQLSRYQGKSYFFDRDRGLEIYIRAADGQYFTFNSKHCISLNPFQLDDTKENHNFLLNWFSQLVKKPEENVIPSEITENLLACINYTFDSLSKPYRNLVNASQLLSINFPRWSQLNRWLPGGQYSYLFSNDEDLLQFDTNKIGFDLTDLLDQPNQILTAVNMYLFHRIEQSLNGQLVSIFLDEGWVYLDNTYWENKLKTWLPTLRKKNCHLVLATQSPSTVINSKLSSQFLDNCATHVFFCNPKGNYEKHYQHFNLSKSEFDFIKQTPIEERLFLYKQSQQSIICKLNLNNLNKELAVYSANNKTLALQEKLRKQLGDNPEDWLPIFFQECKQ